MWKIEALPDPNDSSFEAPRKARPLDYGPFENRGDPGNGIPRSVSYLPRPGMRRGRRRESADLAIRGTRIIV